MDPDNIKNLIEQGLEGASATVTGDGRHFEAIVVCDAFDGKSMVEQHQMVFKALGDNMEEAIHALSMRTLTTAQYKQQ
ncbi:MAG: BolA/IbaG family iron-sulfur metabolism protein [Acidiferrobacterales bacterium]